jgi:hypothetical protein
MTKKQEQDLSFLATSRKYEYTRQLVFYFHFVGIWDISLGLSVDVKMPHLDIHLPFGFIRIGFIEHTPGVPVNEAEFRKNTFGLQERWK